MNCDPRINNLIVGNLNSVIHSNFTLVDLNVSFQFFFFSYNKPKI